MHVCMYIFLFLTIYYTKVINMQCSIFIHCFETCFSFNSIYWKLFNTGTQKVSSLLITFLNLCMGFSGSSDGKASACNVGDLGLIPGLGRSPGEGIGYIQINETKLCVFPCNRYFNWIFVSWISFHIVHAELPQLMFSWREWIYCSSHTETVSS